MIHDLHRQGLSVSAIARQLGVDRKIVRTYIAKGLEPPVYKKRTPAPGIVDRFEPYLRERLAAYPALTGVRLWRELKERGFVGCYSVIRRAIFARRLTSCARLRPSRGHNNRHEGRAAERRALHLQARTTSRPPHRPHPLDSERSARRACLRLARH
jgi:hypothetical protein